MNVLIVSQHFYPEIFRINSVAVSLVKMGCVVDVLTGIPNYPKGICFEGYENAQLTKEIFEGVNIYRVPIFLRRSGNNLRLIINYCSFILSASIIGGIWLKRKYDIIFCYATSPLLQAIPAIFLARKNRAPFVLNVQDLWPDSISATNRIRSPLIISLINLIVGWIYKNSNLILIPSKGFDESIRKSYPRAPIEYWPNSIDPKFYDRDNVSYEIPAPLSNLYKNGIFTVTFAGNIGQAQSIETILKAAELLSNDPNIRIILIGDGSKRTWALTESRKKNLKNVFFPGSYPEIYMIPIYLKSSCLLVSLTDREIFNLTIPNKIQGYLAVGKPIIGSLNGVGANIIKESGAGLVADAENPIMLSKVILQMASASNDVISNYEKNGRKYFIKNYEHNMLMKKLFSIFNNLV